MADHPQFRLLMAGLQWPPETFLERLIDGLAQAGVAVTVGSSRKPAGTSNRVRWLPLPSWDANVPWRLWRLAGLALRAMVCGARDVRVFATHVRQTSTLAERLQLWNRLLPYAGRRWDVIYFPWNSAAIAYGPVFDLGCPVIVSCRGTQVSVAPHNPERAGLRDGLRNTFARAAAVHCVSAATLADAQRLGLDSAKARIIRPAVDTDHFRPAASRPGNDSIFPILTVGSLNWVKGHEWALQAIRRLVDRGVKVRFDIIGEGPDRQRLRYTIADLGLENCTRLLGRLAPAEVLHYLQQAGAFLLSSHSEGISNAALEAMACGVPIVTTDCGGMREAVTDGVEGFVVPVRNAEAMAAALAQLSADPGLRFRRGQAARARAEQEFNLPHHVEQWLQLCRSVLGKVTLANAPSPSDQPAMASRA